MKKYKVPGDMSVMGCDNTLFAKMHKVSLTTIEHFVIYKGRDACDIIMKKMKTRQSRYADMEPVSILSCGIRAEAGRARNDILSAGDTEKRGETEDLKKEKLVF